MLITHNVINLNISDLFSKPRCFNKIVAENFLTKPTFQNLSKYQHLREGFLEKLKTSSAHPHIIFT